MKCFTYDSKKAEEDEAHFNGSFLPLLSFILKKNEPRAHWPYLFLWNFDPKTHVLSELLSFYAFFTGEKSPSTGGFFKRMRQMNLFTIDIFFHPFEGEKRFMFFIFRVFLFSCFTRNYGLQKLANWQVHSKSGQLPFRAPSLSPNSYYSFLSC